MSGWSFTHPLLFALGAALATAPIVIHWLSRRRTRVVEWAAMHLLRGAHRTSQRRVRLEDLLLLAARVLAIFLVGIFLARPILRGSSNGGAWAARGLEHVVLLDDSLSMRTVDSEGAAFDRARRRLIASCAGRAELGRDTVTLLLASRPATPVLERVPLVPDRLDDVLAALERLEPTDAAVDWSRTLDQATQFLAARADAGPQAVYVVSDFRRTDWFDAESRLTSAAEHVQGAARATRPWLLCDVGGEPQANVAITHIAPDGILVAGVTTRWNIHVWNTNPFPVEDAQLRLTAGDGLPLLLDLPTLPPGQATTVTAPVTFGVHGAEIVGQTEERGERWERVQAELIVARADRENRLAADDVGRFAAQVSRGIPVLIVDGAPTTEPRRSDSYYLSRALAPSGVTGTGLTASNRKDIGLTGSGLTNSGVADSGVADSGIRPTVVAEGQWEAGDWYATPRAESLDGRPAYQVIVLCNVFQLSDSAVRRLRRWVDAGGGLVLAPGDQVDRDTFNERLVRGDTSLAPLELVDLAGDSQEQTWSTWSSADDSHAVTRLFAGDDNPLARQVKVFRWWSTREVAPSRVLARFQDRSPAIAERSVGLGRVVMLTIPVDADWSDWPADPSYVVFFQELVAYLAQSQPNTPAVRAGQVLQSRQNAADFKAGAVLRTPGDRRFELPAIPIVRGGADSDNAQWLVQSPETWQAGFYTLEFEPFDGGRIEQLAAVAPEPSESDLRRVRLDDLLRTISSREIRGLTPASDNWFDSLDSGREAWTWMAWCVLGLLAAEQTLAVLIGSKRT